MPDGSISSCGRVVDLVVRAAVDGLDHRGGAVGFVRAFRLAAVAGSDVLLDGGPVLFVRGWRGVAIGWWRAAGRCGMGS